VSEDADAGSGYRALLGDASTHDFYGGAPTWWYAGQTSASIIAGQTRVNGVAIDGKATPRPRILSVVTIQTLGGALTADRLGGGMSAQWWKGHVAELLVYNRVLSASERESVERRLALEYTPLGATVATPEFSPNGGSFEGSVSVSITTATPGATLRYTTNGAQPTEASASYAGPLVLTSSTLLQARAFRAGMEPSSVSAAAFVPGDDVWSPVGIPGLVLRVSSDVGVNADGANKVQSWLDLSGHSNHLGQTTLGSQPSFVPNVASGRGVVRFDGSDDALLFTTRLTSIRTVFWVVREEAAAPNAYHFLLGDGSTYAFHSGSARQIWGSNTDAAVLTGQTRVNGVLVDGTTTNRPTTLSVVSLVTASSVSADAFSRDRTYGRSWWGDLAELIVFDRALTNVERKAVEDGLALKYGLYVPTVGTPVITPNGSTSPVPVRVTIAAEEGAEVHITTDGSEPTVASAGYVEPFVLGAPTVVKARAFRADHQPSAVATARFLDGQTPPPLRASGLKMWVEADVGVTTVGGAVSSWADQSGNGNDLVQATASTRPLLVAGEANGHPVIRLDGVGDFLSFTSRLTTMRTIFWVIRRSPSATPGYRMLLGDTSVGGTYDFSSDGTTKIWSSNFTSANIRSGSTWLNGALINGTTTERPTSLSVLSVVTTGDVRAATISKDRGGDYSWWGDIAALIIYDRALTDTERQMIEGYLASKYAQYVPSVVAPTISPSDGRVTGAQLVQLDSATVGATVRYTLDDTEPTESSTPYAEPLEITGTTRIRARAFRQGWNASPETVVTFFDDADATPARLPGLALWVRADSGLGGPNAVSLWPDQSASANHLIQTGVGAQPSVLVDGTSRMPVVRLDGAGDYLSFTSRLTTIRTVFWVIRRSLLATPGYRMLLGDGVAGGTGSFYSDSTTKIWHLTASNALIRNGVTRLNATPVDGTTTDRPTDLSVISLVTTGNVSASTFSRYSSASDYSWWGDLAELIIYDYPLSDSDVRSIEEYLAGRYGIALAP